MWFRCNASTTARIPYTTRSKRCNRLNIAFSLSLSVSARCILFVDHGVALNSVYQNEHGCTSNGWWMRRDIPTHLLDCSPLSQCWHLALDCFVVIATIGYAFCVYECVMCVWHVACFEWKGDTNCWNSHSYTWPQCVDCFRWFYFLNILFIGAQWTWRHMLSLKCLSAKCKWTTIDEMNPQDSRQSEYVYSLHDDIIRRFVVVVVVVFCFDREERKESKKPQQIITIRRLWRFILICARPMSVYAMHAMPKLLITLSVCVCACTISGEMRFNCRNLSFSTTRSIHERYYLCIHRVQCKFCSDPQNNREKTEKLNLFLTVCTQRSGKIRDDWSRYLHCVRMFIA